MQGTSVHFVAKKGAGVTHEGKPVTDIELAADTTGKPTLLQSGSLTFSHRARRQARHSSARRREPHRKNFAGLTYFPVRDDWVFDARFEPYQPRKHVRIVNILGMEEDLDAPGAIVFQKDGKEYRLDAVLEEPDATELFVMFADGTSGKETYGAGRFMYLDTAEERHRATELQYRVQPAVRVQRVRDVPAATAPEPASGCASMRARRTT